MTLYVVAASVAAKWFLAEEHADVAAWLLNSAHDLIAPDLLATEIANVLLKRSRPGQISAADADAVVAVLPGMVRLRPSLPLMRPALAIALAHGPSIYDALYVALSLREACPVVTADRRLYNALEVALPGVLAWIADLG